MCSIIWICALIRDIADGRKPDISKPGTEFKIDGLHNIIFLVMIVVGVILSGMLPGMPAFQDAAGNVRGIHIFGEVTLSFPSIIEIVLILVAAFLSFKTTDKKIRVRNHFTWGAIKEVAVLFIGIFITMQPALMLLKAVGPNLGITEPYQMFWATGALSSFLDNTPTYLVFLTTAGTLGFTSGIATTLGTVPVKLLSAISCGAVFMGANTYIGNAPNFMVKTLSDEMVSTCRPSLDTWDGPFVSWYRCSSSICWYSFYKGGGSICRIITFERNAENLLPDFMNWMARFIKA